MGDGSWIGLDVHARSTVAAVIDGGSGEVVVCGAPAGVEELVGWVAQHPGPVRAAYEAGPTGFGLARTLGAVGVGCTVAAPSLIPRSPAARGRKRDASDAEALARALRLGELVGVCVPEAIDEAARDLVRAREDARADLMRARHRLSKLLLRNGRVFDGRAWTLGHEAWLRRQRFDHAATDWAFDEYYRAVVQIADRRDGLDARIGELATDPRFAPVVERLSCLRGVGTLTAFALCVEIGDWTRLSGRTIGSYLGLVPSEHQSGQRHTRGPITKAGNGHARRLLVESAWHHRPEHRASPVLERRRAGQRPDVVARAEHAGRRLHRRWRHLEKQRGLRSTVVAVAVARELAGFCWSLAVMDD